MWSPTKFYRLFAKILINFRNFVNHYRSYGTIQSSSAFAHQINIEKYQNFINFYTPSLAISAVFQRHIYYISCKYKHTHIYKYIYICICIGICLGIYVPFRSMGKRNCHSWFTKKLPDSLHNKMTTNSP